MCRQRNAYNQGVNVKSESHGDWRVVKRKCVRRDGRGGRAVAFYDEFVCEPPHGLRAAVSVCEGVNAGNKRRPRSSARNVEFEGRVVMAKVYFPEPSAV